MIKHIFITAILFSFSTMSFGQEKNEKYCEIECHRGGSKFLNTTISYGTDDRKILDSSARNESIIYLKKIKTNTDVINYMSSKGWNLVSACVVTENGNPFFYFYFKKDFGKSY